ncbi:MAG TPA: hypothetical protein VLL52_21720 [Anaerolineae bacterium]|nr:hypothetical protein [Anaerolineae bacterium]
MFNETDLDSLVNYPATTNQIVSIYLNSDTSEESRDAIKLRARNFLKEVEASEADQEVVETYLNHSFGWDQPGLVLFTCQQDGFFKAYPAAVSFRNRVRAGFQPYLKPLAHLCEHYAHYGVILVDQVGASFFHFHLGDLQRTGGTMGDDVRRYKDGGGSTGGAGMRGGQKEAYQDSDETAQRNFRQAAEQAVTFFGDTKIRRLFLGGTSANVAQFREYLPKQLQSALAGTLSLSLDTAVGEVQRQALDLLHKANAEREAKLIDTLITMAAKDGNAVTGLDNTLQAVNEGRVQTLVVSDGWRAPGYLHPASGFTAASLVFSPYPQEELVAVDDVVAPAITYTLEQGGQIEVITNDPQLGGAGHIGALLRYK